MKISKWMAAWIIVLLISGCSILATEGGQAKDLEGTEWLLVSIRDMDTVSGAETTALFEGGQVTGVGGCNQYGGQYDLATGGSDRIEIVNLISTQMFCNEPQGVMDQEQQFLELMNNAYRFEIGGDRLMIFNESGESLTFTASQ